MEFVAVRYVESLPLVVSVSAFLICSGTFAQMSVSAVNGRPDPWNDSDYDRERKHRAIESDVDRVYEDRQSPAAAVVTLHRLAHRVPRCAQQEFKRARVAQLKGDHQAAIVLFQKAIAIDPDFCEALNDLGKSYLEIDQLDLAIEQF
jgi:tetratricopeptide (TPR) repeat protein